MAPTSRRILCVIAPERFRDEELAEPRRALEAAGHKVTVASTRKGPATGMLGARLIVGTTVSECRAEDFDALAIAGGSGSPDHLWDHAPLLALVKVLHAAGKPVAAICLSGAVLARAGVLAGRRATVYPSPRAVLELRRGGATCMDDPVVRDGNLLTARGPEAAPAFGAALVQLLGP